MTGNGRMASRGEGGRAAVGEDKRTGARGEETLVLRLWFALSLTASPRRASLAALLRML